MEDKTHLKVVVVSPGDMQGEPNSLAQILANLNHNIAAEKGFLLDLYSWDTDAYTTFHAQGPEGATDESPRIQDYDIIIGVFWARFGTPVSDASSGTEHELRIAHKSWEENKRPLIMLYFKSEPFPPKTLEEIDQLRRVLEFKETFPQETNYGGYQDLDDLRRRVSNDLTQLLRELSPGDRRLGKAVKQPPTPGRLLKKKAPSIDWASMRLGNVPLYTFSGLRADPRDEDIVQDFRIDKGRHANPNPVSYLWADVYKGNSVTASVEEGDPPHLSITFENKPASWACNVAIRPIEEKAVTTRGRPILAFETRLAPESPPEIFVSVRLANGWCQHWAHGADDRYLLFPVTETWNTIEIPLTSDEWWLFAVGETDAFGPRIPDFSIISAVVLVFGGPGLAEPGPGRGTVLIRNVRLQEPSGQTVQPKPKCFISYSTKDEGFAEQLYSDLQNKGVPCWYAPEDLKIGDKFQDEIEKSIRAHDKLLLVLSEKSVNSPWVEREVQAAREREDRDGKLVLFPVRLDDAVMDTSKEWAADLTRTRHIGDFTRWRDRDSYQKALARLLRDLTGESTGEH